MTEDEIQVRPYKETDKETIVSLCSEHGERRLRSHRAFLENHEGYGWIIIDKKTKEIIAFTAYNPNVINMDSLTVINRICRHKGLAELLLKTKVNHAKSIGIKRYITTIGGTNCASINLVLKCGFELKRAEDRDYGQILVFEKELNQIVL